MRKLKIRKIKIFTYLLTLKPKCVAISDFCVSLLSLTLFCLFIWCPILTQIYELLRTLCHKTLISFLWLCDRKECGLTRSYMKLWGQINLWNLIFFKNIFFKKDKVAHCIVSPVGPCPFINHINILLRN